MYIKNTPELLSEDLEESQFYFRKVALNTLEKAINAVKPENMVKASIKIQDKILSIQNDKYDLSKYSKIYIIGGGKATAEMAFTVENLLKQNLDVEYEGIINVPKDSVNHKKLEASKIKINYASHPIPDVDGLHGTKKMIQLIEKSGVDDLVLFLISGGGSALLTLPVKGIKLEDLQILTSLLLKSGADIYEINSIRKHISAIKGGNLVKTLETTSGAELISLIISDVVGDKLDYIASGPTVPDTSSFKDAYIILKKYDLYKQIPVSIKLHLRAGLRNNKLETPKYYDHSFNNVHNYLIGSVKIAVKEVIPFLKTAGFKTIYFSDEIRGEAVEFGGSLYEIILNKLKEAYEKDISDKFALIGTGELTVKIKGNGIGGRNQEMLLSFLNIVRKKELNYDFLIIGANLDGVEGNSRASGGLIDNHVLTQIDKNKIDIKLYLRNNDSNSFLKQTKTEIVTGPTGCNVNDLVLILLQIKA